MKQYPANLLTRLDYPDVDVIRVDDTYYMVSTTMYFMPESFASFTHSSASKSTGLNALASCSYSAQGMRK